MPGNSLPGWGTVSFSRTTPVRSVSNCQRLSSKVAVYWFVQTLFLRVLRVEISAQANYTDRSLSRLFSVPTSQQEKVSGHHRKFRHQCFSYTLSSVYYLLSTFQPGVRGGAVVEALRYETEGRGFDSRWWHNPSVRTMPLGMTWPLTEMSTRNISWEVKAAGA